MIVKVDQPVALICIFLWVGFVCAISFMEAWLKFRAPGVTLAVGLGIGRIVFASLNKVEWIFAIVITGSMLWSRSVLVTWQNGLLLVAILILTTQTAWLLPQLDARTELQLTGKPVSLSNLHIYFVAAEVIKTMCLVIGGVALFKPL